MGCHALLQGISLTQGSNLCLLHPLHWWAGSLPLHHLGSPVIFLHINITVTNKAAPLTADINRQVAVRERGSTLKEKTLNKCCSIIHLFIHPLKIVKLYSMHIYTHIYVRMKLSRQLLKINPSGGTDLKTLYLQSLKVTVIIYADNWRPCKIV